MKLPSEQQHDKYFPITALVTTIAMFVLTACLAFLDDGRELLNGSRAEWFGFCLFDIMFCIAIPYAIATRKKLRSKRDRSYAVWCAVFFAIKLVISYSASRR